METHTGVREQDCSHEHLFQTRRSLRGTSSGSLTARKNPGVIKIIKRRGGVKQGDTTYKRNREFRLRMTITGLAQRISLKVHRLQIQINGSCTQICTASAFRAFATRNTLASSDTHIHTHTRVRLLSSLGGRTFIGGTGLYSHYHHDQQDSCSQQSYLKGYKRSFSTSNHHQFNKMPLPSQVHPDSRHLTCRIYSFLDNKTESTRTTPVVAPIRPVGLGLPDNILNRAEEVCPHPELTSFCFFLVPPFIHSSRSTLFERYR
ncbi:hypothetical protein BJ165DRAFT_200813 [Panaeolus papilionaceus]|nr:hypothetical protein BJ165DRAFT_200813 [Panaeolus papilionaceus]